MKKRDYFFILFILLICALLLVLQLFPNKKGEIVQIYVNSDLYRELPLNKNCIVEIGSTNTLIIRDGYAYMHSASCPDKLCIKQGKICDSKRDIVCLPNKISVHVTAKSGLDAVSQ